MGITGTTEHQMENQVDNSMEHERFIDSQSQQGPVVDERHGTKRFSCSARGTLCQLGILRQRCRRVEAPNAKSSANPRGPST